MDTRLDVLPRLRNAVEAGFVFSELTIAQTARNLRQRLGYCKGKTWSETNRLRVIMGAVFNFRESR